MAKFAKFEAADYLDSEERLLNFLPRHLKMRIPKFSWPQSLLLRKQAGSQLSQVAQAWGEKVCTKL